MCVCFYQKGGVGSSDCAVRFDKRGLQFAHLLHGGRADAVVLGHNIAAWKETVSKWCLNTSPLFPS